MKTTQIIEFIQDMLAKMKLSTEFTVTIADTSDFPADPKPIGIRITGTFKGGALQIAMDIVSKIDAKISREDETAKKLAARYN